MIQDLLSITNKLQERLDKQRQSQESPDQSILQGELSELRNELQRMTQRGDKRILHKEIPVEKVFCLGIRIYANCNPNASKMTTRESQVCS